MEAGLSLLVKEDGPVVFCLYDPIEVGEKHQTGMAEGGLNLSRIYSV